MTFLLKRRKKSLKAVHAFFEKPHEYFIIHYSCESFMNRKEITTPRIATIVVRNLDTAQVTSFSLLKEAEFKNITADKIEDEYNVLEKAMLEKFFNFVENNQHAHYIHWNMRDENFGFNAIQQRYSVLMKEEMKLNISDNNKHDLARIIVDIYGKSYIGHPRLEKLIKLNNITEIDFLNGADEAKAFENKEFSNLHKSTLRKADIFSNILGSIEAKELKTCFKSKVKQILLYPSYYIDSILKHWIVTLVISCSGLIAFYYSLIDKP